MSTTPYDLLAGFLLLEKEAIVMPILKHGKDSSSISSYRPIALANCLCKLFENMMNCRLLYFLESNELLHTYECGFREGWSTTVHLICIKAQIREAFIHKQFFLSFFLDMDQAYDATWHFVILSDLSHLGIRGNMLSVIENYLVQ